MELIVFVLYFAIAWDEPEAVKIREFFGEKDAATNQIRDQVAPVTLELLARPCQIR